jgi:hypothetical protein
MIDSANWAILPPCLTSEGIDTIVWQARWYTAKINL